MGDYDLMAIQRGALLMEKARKAVRARRWTERPGARWTLTEINTPQYLGVEAKALIFASDDGSAYTVNVFAHRTGDAIGTATYKGLDAAFRNGERMSDAPL